MAFFNPSQAQPPAGPGGQGQSSPPVSPSQLLNMLIQAPASSLSKPQGPQMPGMKDEKGKGKEKGPAGGIQTAIDKLQKVVEGLGPQSDVAVALSGIIKNLEIQKSKVGHPQDQKFEGANPMNKPPLGIGTPGQTPPGQMGQIMQPPTVAPNLTGNLP